MSSKELGKGTIWVLVKNPVKLRAEEGSLGSG
jgi:hypothetical protein